MAAGDEKVDVFDQVRVLNRLSDGPVEIQFDGKFYRWTAGQIRAIPRAYATHFLNHSTFRWDPTESNYPQRTLVIVDEAGVAVDASQGASADPLVVADTQVLDLIDDSNLPDRYFDPETGEPLRNKVGRMAQGDPRHFRGRGVVTPHVKPGMKNEVAAAIAGADIGES